MTSKAGQQWLCSYLKSEAESGGPDWPSEILVRLFRGAYIPDMNHDHKGRKILEVGAGNGNNLLFLASNAGLDRGRHRDP